jgi:hypothetical protein
MPPPQYTRDILLTIDFVGMLGEQNGFRDAWLCVSKFFSCDPERVALRTDPSYPSPEGEGNKCPLLVGEGKGEVFNVAETFRFPLKKWKVKAIRYT